MKTSDIIYAKDQLINLAHQLPNNLVIEANSAKGLFEIQFLSILSNNDHKLLKKIAEEQKEAHVHLEFFTIEEGSTECPKELKDFPSFRWENLCEIQIKKAQPHLDHAEAPFKAYVSITLVV